MLAAIAGMAITAAPASGLTITPKFKNWVVYGTLTDKKLDQPIALPAGSTFNGEATATLPTFEGTITGSVYVPPWTATLSLPVPTTVGLTFTQVGTAEGTIKPAPEPEVACPGSGGQFCVALDVPVRANIGITEAGVSALGLAGVSVSTHCETVEPLSLDLRDDLTTSELLHTGPHFSGTTTIPPLTCEGLSGVALGPALTLLMSGPGNPYSFSISPSEPL